MANQYFGSNQKGELNELYQDLNDLNFEKKKDAVKKVIAYMTVGKDVSSLFQCVIKCLEHNDIELKKLIYLYIINYSKQRPDDAIMVIQLFRKDVRKTENPLVRALAVRTFGCLRVSKLNDYLIEPLKECLNDEDPYVRKTAVLCVPKVYEVSPDLVNTNGLIEAMQKQLEKESNSLVVANLIQSLQEISYMKNEQLIQLQTNSLQKILLALNECIEWGQIFILDFLGYYNPKTGNETEIIIERILPRLSHINPSVVFASCKVILKYLGFLENAELVKNLCKKLSPSLVSLLSWNQSEIQYSILKNMGIIIQKYPILFENNVKVFFCSFNDPYYLKYEKLDMMVRISDKNNFAQVINELALYVNEADPEFVRRSIRALGRIGLQFEKAAEKQGGVVVIGQSDIDLERARLEFDREQERRLFDPGDPDADAEPVPEESELGVPGEEPAGDRPVGGVRDGGGSESGVRVDPGGVRGVHPRRGGEDQAAGGWVRERGDEGAAADPDGVREAVPEVPERQRAADNAAADSVDGVIQPRRARQRVHLLETAVHGPGEDEEAGVQRQHGWPGGGEQPLGEGGSAGPAGEPGKREQHLPQGASEEAQAGQPAPGQVHRPSPAASREGRARGEEGRPRSPAPPGNRPARPRRRARPAAPAPDAGQVRIL